MPNLAAIQLLASDTPQRTVTLSGMSVTVLFTALDAANRLYDWQGSTFSLSPAEIDLIDVILSDARHELMALHLGEIRLFATATAPAGCLLCDGAAYDRVDYPALYNKISANYIVDADQFLVPDLREKFVFGANDLTEIGASGGAANVTLAESEIPSHSHSIGGAGTSIAAPGAVPVLTPSIIPSSTGAAGGGGFSQQHTALSKTCLLHRRGVNKK